MGDRFQMSWATLASKAHPDGQWASAYHIKVAVRDGNTFWLSSGNWQSSNQPDVHPFADPPGPLPPSFQRKYNRDYHAVIENETLAAAYETYIKRDYELTATAAAPSRSHCLTCSCPKKKRKRSSSPSLPNSFNRCDWSGN